MNESIKQILFFTKFMIVKPFENLAKVFKLRNAKKFVFVITLLLLFEHNLSIFFYWLEPNFKSTAFNAALGISLILYIVSYSLPAFGETWKQRYKQSQKQTRLVNEEVEKIDRV